MRIAVLTSLYPSSVRPFEGIFAERRWTKMESGGHYVRVTHPLPWAPPALVHLGPPHWREIGAMARREVRAGIEIARPRYAHVPGRAIGNARRFAAAGVAELLGQGPLDAVVADYAWPAAAAADELARRGIPLLVNGRGSDVLEVSRHPSLRAELARCLKLAGHWCAVSADLVRAMDELAGVSGHGRLVANGVDLELFKTGSRSAARARLELPLDSTLVLCVGHLIERKDPLLALRAFERGAPETATLAWIGRGPLRDELVREADALGLRERLRLPGELSAERLVDWYQACDVLLLTSTREGRPNVVLEALACGRPCLATDAGGTSEVLSEREGVLARSRDPSELGRALSELLRRVFDPEAIRRSAERFSWDASCRALEECLNRAAGTVPAA